MHRNLVEKFTALFLSTAILLAGCTGKISNNGNAQGYTGKQPGSIQGNTFYLVPVDGHLCPDNSLLVYSVALQFNAEKEVIAYDPCANQTGKLSDYTEAPEASPAPTPGLVMTAKCSTKVTDTQISEVNVYENSSTGDYTVKMTNTSQNTVIFPVDKDKAREFKMLNSNNPDAVVIFPIGVNNIENPIPYECRSAKASN